MEITDLSHRGDGIAKIQGFVIFVAGAKAGQKLRIKITSVAPRFANAQVVTGAEGQPPSSEESKSSQ